MSKSGENIHKRKDGRWEGRFKKGRDLSGKILYGFVYGNTYREAKEKLQTAATDLLPAGSDSRSSMEFGAVLSDWLRCVSVGSKASTFHKYRAMIDRHIAPCLGTVKVSKLNSNIINGFLNDKLKNGKLDGTGGLAPSYVRSMQIIIKSALKYAAVNGYCESASFAIPRPAVKKREASVLPREEQHRLEEYIARHGGLVGLGVLLSLRAGLRIGEVCALSWEDVDLSKEVIHIRHTVARVDSTEAGRKTKLILDAPKTASSERYIPICSDLLTVLKRIRSGGSSGFVVSGSEYFVSPRTFEYRYHTLLKAAKVSSVNFHCLRHTFATRCIEAGVDVKSLSEILGHSSVSITMDTYVHSSIELKRAQIEKLRSLPCA